MPAFLNWFLRLLPTNPICMRLVQGGSRRLRHFYIRAGYLGVLMIVLLIMMLGGAGTATFSQLARKGAQAFELISYLQLGLICLLTPVFMAGAIAQEANPKTWDILLTTPMNNLQIVLGNMFGRLFFILALLFSTLPLFVAVQYFGGVPGSAIFQSYLIAGLSAMIVAAIAVTLSVTRTAGRRAVFIFYIAVVMYLFVTYAIDVQLRSPVGIASSAMNTTWITPLNPFLALEVLLRSNTYQPHVFIEDTFWLKRLWLGDPIATFVWICFLITLFLSVFSTLRLRIIGARTGTVPWYRRAFGLGLRGGGDRPPRHVGANPIVWREAVARGATTQARLIRWGFAAMGLLVAVITVTMFHAGLMGPTSSATGGPVAATANTFRTVISVIVSAEIVIIALTALNTSATAVSKEREDGSLDILLTTPIQPGPYLYGKLRGLVQFLIPMICVPAGTLAIVGVYVLFGGFGNESANSAPIVVGTTTTTAPVLMPESALAMPIMFVPFIAFCVMVGLQWSIKSKGTISSVVSAVGIVIAVSGMIGLCGVFAGSSMGPVGPFVNAFNPVNFVVTATAPDTIVSAALPNGVDTVRTLLVFGAIVSAIMYALLVYGMHQNMKRTFHMTVRKLAGQK